MFQVFSSFLSGSFATSRVVWWTHLSVKSYCSGLACLPPGSAHSCHPGSSSLHSSCGNFLCLCPRIRFFSLVYFIAFSFLVYFFPQVEDMLPWIAEKRSMGGRGFETLHIWKCFPCTLSLDDYWAGCRIPGWKSFFFTILKASLHCRLLSLNLAKSEAVLITLSFESELFLFPGNL